MLSKICSEILQLYSTSKTFDKLHTSVIHWEKGDDSYPEQPGFERYLTADNTDYVYMDETLGIILGEYIVFDPQNEIFRNLVSGDMQLAMQSLAFLQKERVSKKYKTLTDELSAYLQKNTTEDQRYEGMYKQIHGKKNADFLYKLFVWYKQRENVE